MEIILVKTLDDARRFIEFVPALYKNDPAYIRPLDMDIERIFNPATNPRFAYGQAQRWLLVDNNQAIGRIAAFTDSRKLDQTGLLRIGSIGFFECIHSAQAAQMLLHTAEAWLASQGANTVEGPVNFGERDRFWGLLVSGFTQPNYACNYNPPYYKPLLEAQGYKDFFQQYTYGRNISIPLNERVYKIAARTKRDPNYRFAHIEKGKVKAYAEPFRQVYNNAWERHPGVPEMTSEQAMDTISQLAPMVDHRLIWFAWYKQRPIAFYLMLPELNTLFKHFDGKFGLWQKIQLMALRYGTPQRKLLGLVYGVVPDFQGKGVESALIVTAGTLMQNKAIMPYRTMELNWIGDFNPKMNSLALAMDAQVVKTHITYRKMLDPSLPFEREKII
jgi:hypothetical protein